MLHNDTRWNTTYSDIQEENYNEFIKKVTESGEELLIIELGVNPNKGTFELLSKKLPQYDKSK